MTTCPFNILNLVFCYYKLLEILEPVTGCSNDHDIFEDEFHLGIQFTLRCICFVEYSPALTNGIGRLLQAHVVTLTLTVHIFSFMR